MARNLMDIMCGTQLTWAALALARYDYTISLDLLYMFVSLWLYDLGGLSIQSHSSCFTLRQRVSWWNEIGPGHDQFLLCLGA